MSGGRSPPRAGAGTAGTRTRRRWRSRQHGAAAQRGRGPSRPGAGRPGTGPGTGTPAPPCSAAATGQWCSQLARKNRCLEPALLKTSRRLPRAHQQWSRQERRRPTQTAAQATARPTNARRPALSPPSVDQSPQSMGFGAGGPGRPAPWSRPCGSSKILSSAAGSPWARRSSFWSSGASQTGISKGPRPNSRVRRACSGAGRGWRL